MADKQIKKVQFHFFSVRVKLLIGIFILSVVLMISVTFFLFFMNVKTNTEKLYKEAESISKLLGISVLDQDRAIDRIIHEEYSLKDENKEVQENLMEAACEEVMKLEGLRCVYAVYYIPKEDGTYDFKFVDDNIFWGKDSSGKNKERSQQPFKEQFKATDFSKLNNEQVAALIKKSTPNDLGLLEEIHKPFTLENGETVEVHEKTIFTHMSKYDISMRSTSKDMERMERLANILGLKYGIAVTTVYVQDNYEYYDYENEKYENVAIDEPQAVESIFIEINPFYFLKNTQNLVNELAIWFYGATLFFMAMLLIYVSVFITNPLKKLTKAALSESSIRENGKLVAMNRFKIKNRDEIGELHKAMKNMEDDINRYVDEITVATENRKKMESELEIATQIQLSALPNEFPEAEEYDLFATTHPAKEVGGDFYDFFMIDDTHLALVMADVSDKGIPAAMFMMRAKTLINATAKLIDSPKEIMEMANDNLCKENGLYMFVTAWIGIVDLKTGEVKASNAGHENPIIKRKEGIFEEFEDEHGLVLAAMEGTEMTEYSFTLNSGDVLYLYTDGVPEANNTENEQFGIERALDALNQNPEASSKELIDAVSSKIMEFRGKANQFDDITMMAFRFFGTENLNS